MPPSTHPSPTPDETFEELKPLVALSAHAQEEVVAFRARYDARGEDEPLPPTTLRRMHDGRRRYLELQERLAAIVQRGAPLVDDASMGQRDLSQREESLAMALLAALTIYDNYLSLLLILEDERLRRLILDPAFGYGMPEGELRAMARALHGQEARATLRGLLDAWSRVRESSKARSERAKVLEQAIESSVAYRHARNRTLARELPSVWERRRTRFLDALSALGEEALGVVSEAFGNGIGAVELRDGKLREREEVTQRLLAELRPLDLLLEKTPFRLTDQFIPGHYGHVGIWMGTEAEIETRGVWALDAMQAPALAQHRAPIAAGRSVLEALRSGVQLSTLQSFLNVDDLAVLRPTRLTDDEVQASLVRGFEQVGKEYDFNFDLETLDSVVCSELPYHVYPGVAWDVSNQLGRFTIEPDQVAAQALSPDGAFELVTLYHDGALVPAEAAEARMRALLAED